MKKSMKRALLAVSALLIIGCGANQPADENALTIEEGKNDTLLAELLTKPRQELAQMAEEWADRLAAQEKDLRLGNTRFLLLPEMRFPRMLPVWREAAYSAKAGFSLPPYIHEGGTDPVAAVHLARYGDVEAARKLGGEDADVLAQIDDFRLNRNYPVEWTRLVGFMQQEALHRLGTGDLEGARELMSFHSQLRETLEPKAAKGLLGAALLGRGYEALAQAALVLKKGTDKELAEKIETALADWGTTPAPSPMAEFPWTSRRADLARSLASQEKGRVVVASSVLRALDLLELPVPSEGVQAVVAFYNTSDRLTDLLVTYRPGLVESIPDASNLGQLLEEAGLPGSGAGGKGGARRRTYQAGVCQADLALVSQSPVVGAVARFQRPESSSEDLNPSKGWGNLRRDFGLVHLDRSFEQNRLRIAPELPGDQAQTKRADRLSQVASPLGQFHPSLVTAQREKGHEAISQLVFEFDWDQKIPALHQIVLPLWTSFGPGRLEEITDEQGDRLQLIWQDAQTRYSLNLPYSEGTSVTFVAENQREGSPSGAGTVTFDQREREARIKANKPLTRLPRELEGLRLGFARDKAVAALPSGSKNLMEEVGTVVHCTLTGEPSKSTSLAPRHLVLRFNETKHLAEVQVLYERGPGADGIKNWSQSLLDRWKKECGAPTVRPSPSAPVWSDLNSRAASQKQFAWQDDLTRLSFECDGSMASVVIRDCPVEHPAGTPLPALEYLPRGPKNCLLGTTRASLLQAWKDAKPEAGSKVDLVLRPAKDSPFDALYVWFEGNRVTRIVAWHRPAGMEALKAGQMGKALTTAWGKNLLAFGWPACQEFTKDDVLENMMSHDDSTRVRLSWQESNDGPPRIFTEWKDLGSFVKTAAVRP